jgi:hypothetical protein
LATLDTTLQYTVNYTAILLLYTKVQYTVYYTTTKLRLYTTVTLEYCSPLLQITTLEYTALLLLYTPVLQFPTLQYYYSTTLHSKLYFTTLHCVAPKTPHQNAERKSRPVNNDDSD